MAKKQKRRMPPRLKAVMYVYVTPQNRRYAKAQGGKQYGSFSNYIDSLITLDRTQKLLVQEQAKAIDTAVAAGIV